MKLLIEKHREFNVETHIAFIDFQKVFDKVNRNRLLNILADNHIPQQIISNIFNLYRKTMISIKLSEKLTELKEIFTGVRQGCALSPLLFNIYMNKSIKEFRHKTHSHIRINIFTNFDTLRYADDLTLLATSEDELQRFIHNLKQKSGKYSMEISIDKTKIMTFCGKDPVTSKICINNTNIGKSKCFQVSWFQLIFFGRKNYKIQQIYRNY